MARVLHTLHGCLSTSVVQACIVSWRMNGPRLVHITCIEAHERWDWVSGGTSRRLRSILPLQQREEGHLRVARPFLGEAKTQRASAGTVWKQP